MAKLVLGKSVLSDWFFLDRDFAVRSKACIFVLEKSRQIQNWWKFATKTAKKTWILPFFTAKLPEKAKKKEILATFQRCIDEEDEHSQS